MAVSNGDKKVRVHKVMDTHPVVGTALLMFLLLLLMMLSMIVATILTSFIPGYPEQGPLSVIAAVLVAEAAFCGWFKGESAGFYRKGDIRPLPVFVLLFAAYWILSEVLGVILDGAKIGLPGLNAVLTAFYAGFIEELIFRGLIITPLMRKCPGKKRIYLALILSAVIFGLAHGMNFFSGADPGRTVMQIFSSFAMGTLFAVLYLQTGNLLPAMLFHFAHDVIAFCNVDSVAEDGTITKGIEVGTYVNLLLVIVLAVISLWLLHKDSGIDRVLALWRRKWDSDTEITP